MAGWCTYTPDLKYLVGPLENSYITITVCNGSGVSVCGGLGNLVAGACLGEREWNKDWLPTRFHEFQIMYLNEAFRDRCAKARGKKFSGSGGLKRLEGAGGAAALEGMDTLPLLEGAETGVSDQSSAESIETLGEDFV